MWAESATAAGTEPLSLAPRDAAIVNAGPSRGEVAFNATATDADGTAWAAEAVFSVRPLETEIRARWTLSPARPAALAVFGGPLVGVGEAGFGTRKHAALVPGLEWLEGDEVSSSTLDIRTG
jgi:hypothetical protein